MRIILESRSSMDKKEKKMRQMSVGILAGGKSTRMGKNKAVLPFHNRSFIEGILEACNGFGEILVSVDSVSAYEWLFEKNGSLRLAEDEKQEFGPVEGIYQILKKMSFDRGMIVATDMPFLTEAFLEKITEEAGEEDCLVLTLEGRVQPLCSLYSKACIPVLEEMRQKEIHKPRFLYDHVKTRYLEAERLGNMEGALRNINTPEEYEQAMREETCAT